MNIVDSFHGFIKFLLNRSNLWVENCLLLKGQKLVHVDYKEKSFKKFENTYPSSWTFTLVKILK